MKRSTILAFAMCGVLVGLRPEISRAADSTTEAQLIATLQSPSASWQEKNEACAKLKHIGTSRSVPVLAKLLTDEQLSICARYALESMPNHDAEKALLQALPKTSGALEIGIINSLAVRGEQAAVPALSKLLSVPDKDVAEAAAGALGQIGGPKSLRILEHAAATSTGSAHRTEVDGILASANRSLEAGKRKDALKTFEHLEDTEKSYGVQIAAFRGILMASGTKGIKQLTDAIVIGDGPHQGAALRAASQWKGAELTAALVNLLPTSPTRVQLALIQCLAQRGDPAAMPMMAKLADYPDADVSEAAIAALGVLGDDSVVALLADKASGSGAKRNAARQSLTEVNRGPVTQRMLELLKTASVPAKAELMRALAVRGDQKAVPTLLDLAQNGSDDERAAAFQALGQLADGAQISTLVQLVANAHSDDARSSAADALTSVFQRVQSSGTKLDVSTLVTAVQNGAMETRLALLPVCSEVTQEPVRSAIRAAMSDSDARIRDAGVHALCDTKDAELLPDLLKLACDTNQTTARLLAVRGCVRLATQEDTVQLSKEKKLETLGAILASPLDTREKRVALSGLGAVADPKSLELAMRMLDDEGVRAESEQAIIKIAGDISHAHPRIARSALKKITQTTSNPDTKKTAEDALKKIK